MSLGTMNSYPWIRFWLGFILACLDWLPVSNNMAPRPSAPVVSLTTFISVSHRELARTEGLEGLGPTLIMAVNEIPQ